MKKVSIIAIRIDGRLIHGQVANLWTTKLNISRIMVIDDEVSENEIEKSGLKLATPSGVKLSVLSVKKAAINITSGKYDSQKLFIIVRKPDRLLKLLKLGVPLKEINVGNMSQSEHSRAITKSINVLESDIEDFKKLDDAGVKLVSQMVPGDKSEDFMKLLRQN